MSERILIVEDEATLRTNIQRYLTKLEHEAHAVGSGDEALALLGERSFDVVLTDLRLPGADGLAILDHARAVSPESVVLIMTAYASLSSAVEALRRGAHDYLLKPISLAALGTKIERIVSRGQASPPDFWYDQETDEWVMVLAGRARLEIEGEETPVELGPGQWIDLPAHTRHRVAWTSDDPPTVWLAVHISR